MELQGGPPHPLHAALRVLPPGGEGWVAGPGDRVGVCMYDCRGVWALWAGWVPTRVLTFMCVPCSWGRWREILSHGRFKRRLSERDVETICRAILVYCLLHYRGDENIKGFIWDLISPSENGKAKELQNHSGEGPRSPPCPPSGAAGPV